MFTYVIAAALIASPQAFEDLEALDEMISQVDASALPVDARLKLAVCPTQPTISPPVGGSVVVRCEAKGWRLRVPVGQQTDRKSPGVAQAQILVRKGEVVECIDAGAGFAVSTSMVALEDGALGQPIRVKSLTPTSAAASAVTATITARGVVSL